MVSGPKLQILAAENLILGRSLSYVPSWLSLVLSATAFLAVVIISLAGTRHSFGKIAGLIGLALVIEGFGFWLYIDQPILLQSGFIQTQVIARAQSDSV